MLYASKALLYVPNSLSYERMMEFYNKKNKKHLEIRKEKCIFAENIHKKKCKAIYHSHIIII
jgi:hypothetical protein